MTEQVASSVQKELPSCDLLLTACADNNLLLVESLLIAGVSPKHRAGGNFAMYFASSTQNMELFRLLLRYDDNQVDFMFRLAVKDNNMEEAKVLLEHTAGALAFTKQASEQNREMSCLLKSWIVAAEIWALLSGKQVRRLGKASALRKLPQELVPFVASCLL